MFVSYLCSTRVLQTWLFDPHNAAALADVAHGLPSRSLWWFARIFLRALLLFLQLEEAFAHFRHGHAVAGRGAGLHLLLEPILPLIFKILLSPVLFWLDVVLVLPAPPFFVSVIAICFFTLCFHSTKLSIQQLPAALDH